MGNQNRPRQPPIQPGATQEVPLRLPGQAPNKPDTPYKPPFMVNTPPTGVSPQAVAAHTPPPPDPPSQTPAQTHPAAFQEPPPGPPPNQPIQQVPQPAAPVPPPPASQAMAPAILVPVPQAPPAPPMFQAPHDQPVVQDLMRSLIDSQRQAGQNFYLVVIPDDGVPRVEEFQAVGAIIDRIIELLGTECALFPFLGHKLGITKGPTRFLRTPFGGMLPLFRIPPPEEADVDETGWVGREVQVLTVPQHESEMAQANAADDAAAAAQAATPAAVPTEDDTPAV